MRFFNFNFARRRNSAPVARERLQILLEYERRIISQSDLVAVLRQEILAVVSRHVSVDPEKVQVKVERGAKVSTLEVDVEFPSAGAGVNASA
jgi:cell division topological specificity factor